MNYKIGDKVRYTSGTYWFPNENSKTGEIKSISKSGNLADVAFNDHQTLACYSRELELVGEEK